MSKHYEKLDARLASIDGSLAAVAKVFVILVETGLLEKLLAALADAGESTEASGVADVSVGSVAEVESPFAIPVEKRRRVYCVTAEGIRAGKWVTCKEAWGRLCIVKATLDKRLNAGVLTRFHKKGDEHLQKPRVWLSHEEVENHYRDYTLLKGKEK